MFKQIVLTALIAFFTIGCSSNKGILFQQETSLLENKARIYFYRTAGHGEAGFSKLFNTRLSVFVDKIGEIDLPLEQYEIHVVEPGTYTFKVSSDMSGELYRKDKDVRIPIYREETLEAGDELFVNLYTVDSRRERKTKLKIVEKELALKQLSTMYKVLN